MIPDPALYVFWALLLLLLILATYMTLLIAVHYTRLLWGGDTL